MAKREKTYLARPMNINKAINVMAQTMKQTGVRKNIQQNFNPTVKEWTGDKPDFISEVEKGNEVILHQIRLEGPDKAVPKWFWLSFGTSVRYATMTPDFQSKTRPGTLKNRKGKGGVLFIDRSKPRPGIEARLWHEIIARAAKPVYVKDLMKALRKNKGKIFPKSRVVNG